MPKRQVNYYLATLLLIVSAFAGLAAPQDKAEAATVLRKKSIRT
jgi:hypothetical protein